MADDGLNVTKGGRDAIKNAIELDEDRGACRQNDIAIACHPHGVAAGYQICGNDGLRGISKGDLGNGRDGLADGLLEGHESEAVGRGTREARDTSGAHRTRQFYHVDTKARAGARRAPGRDPVALDEIHGIPVGACYGFVNRFNGESLCHLGAPTDDRLDASDGNARTAWGRRTIQLDTHDGAHARGDVSIGCHTDGVACYGKVGADEGNGGIAEEDQGEIRIHIRKGGLVDIHGAIDEKAWGALCACGACIACGTGGAEGWACGPEGTRGT